jgi:hypothetical protein
MLEKHARCFQTVANQLECIIACRSVGKFVGQLLGEGYASKGYHIKAKSCDWGPMAGFVLNDARFGKTSMVSPASSRSASPASSSHSGPPNMARRGSLPFSSLERDGSLPSPNMDRRSSLPYLQPERRQAREILANQRRAIETAVSSGSASTTLVCISQARKAWLEITNTITTSRLGDNNRHLLCSATSSVGKRMQFILIRSMNSSANGNLLWEVYYDPSESLLSGTVLDQETGGLKPVLALVDPARIGLGYRAALTGDYDLWGVFSKVENYDPKGEDRRNIPRSDRFSVSQSEFEEHADPNMGNITNRIKDVKSKLNSALRREGGYQGGDLIHHGDEVGRPYVKSVELGFIAFVPHAKEAYFIATINDLKTFSQINLSKYHFSLNPGWASDLGFSVTSDGNYEA